MEIWRVTSGPGEIPPNLALRFEPRNPGLRRRELRPVYADQSALTLTPVVGWIHQLGEDDVVGAFPAPRFSHEMRSARDRGFSGYCGVRGRHYFSDQFQLLYGGVYQNSFGEGIRCPYLGVKWLPTPHWSIALVFPWSMISDATSDR